MQGSPSPWRDLTCPPFTPYTPHSAASFGTPQTPYTPQVLYWRATGSNNDGLKGIRSDVTALPDIGVQMESAGELGRYLMVNDFGSLAQMAD